MTSSTYSNKTVSGGLKIEKWINQEAIGEIAYSQYWNDEEIEKTKPFYAVDRGIEQVDDYVGQTGLVEDFEFCVANLKTKGICVGGVGVDLAAGALWMLPILFKALPVTAITCVEYSQHRLLKLGPKIIEHYNLPTDKITLALGSFYDIRLPAESVDFALLCQALHHADDPGAVLKQLSRVLRPGGVVIVTGEHIVRWTPFHDIRHSVLYFSTRLLPKGLQSGQLRSPYGRPRHFIARSDEVFAPDPVLGDHYILPRDYRKMFAEEGFSVDLLYRRGSKCLSLVAVKNRNLVSQ